MSDVRALESKNKVEIKRLSEDINKLKETSKQIEKNGEKGK